MSLIQTDYHMHTTFSDGRHTMLEMAKYAQASGLQEIAFTEHAEWIDGRSGFAGPAAYFQQLAKIQPHFAEQGLQLRSGVEMGNPHQFNQQAIDLLNSYSFDIRIASLHWLDGRNIQRASCFEGYDPDEVYTRYFSELKTMVEAFTDFDILAHFDRIFLPGTKFQRFDPYRFEAVVRDAFATIAEHGCALELNMRYLNYEDHWRDELAILYRWFREEGGRKVVINSDAHQMLHLTANAHLAMEILTAAGAQSLIGNHITIPQH